MSKRSSTSKNSQKDGAAELLARGKDQITKIYSDLFDNDTAGKSSASSYSTPSSSVEDRASNDDYYPKFQKSEIQLGKVLGTGGFATVYEIKAFSLKDGNNKIINHIKANKNNKAASSGYAVDDEDRELEDQYEHSTRGFQQQNDTVQFQDAARSFLSQHCFRGVKKRDARYAFKILIPSQQQQTQQQSQQKDQQKFLQGILDIAIEARFLSALQHPNIIKVRAMAQGDLFQQDYFLVMDRLYDTLQRRIYKVWLPKSKRQESFLGKIIVDRKGQKRDALFEERLVYGLDLSSALTYLHDRKIIYRDLKTENIGFDVRGDIKVFDFGLARFLKDSLLVEGETDLYRLTKETGSPRYMSPENAKGEPYNATCDTYSFCILLWEMLALQSPFEVYTMTKMKERVWGNEQKRPFINEAWTLPIKLLLRKGWTSIVNDRLSMKQVEEILQEECIRIGGNADDLLGPQRRLSDTSVVFQQHREKKGKTAHEVFMEDYTEFSERERIDQDSGNNVVDDDGFLSPDSSDFFVAEDADTSPGSPNAEPPSPRISGVSLAAIAPTFPETVLEMEPSEMEPVTVSILEKKSKVPPAQEERPVYGATARSPLYATNSRKDYSQYLLRR